MITAETVGNWLISTPAGVLLLSAAGSLLGLGVLRLSNYAFIFLRQGRRAWNYREFRRGYEVGFIAGVLAVKRDPFETVLYAAYRISRLLVSLASLLIFIVIFAAALPAAGSPALTVTTFLSGMFAFIAVRFVYEEYIHIRHLFEMACSTIIDALKAQREITSNDDGEDQPSS